MSMDGTSDFKRWLAQADKFVNETPELSMHAETLRPVIIDHVKQARDCLDRIATVMERDGKQADSVVIHGYYLQHDEHIKTIRELANGLAQHMTQIIAGGQE